MPLAIHQLKPQANLKQIRKDIPCPRMASAVVPEIREDTVATSAQEMKEIGIHVNHAIVFK